MSSRTLLNAGMGFVAILAALLVYLHKPETPPAELALVPISQDRIRSIDITRANGAAIALQRDGTRWRMTAPVVARLDETALARVLALSRLAAGAKLTTDDPARYGLDQPWAQVRFDDHLLEFGNTNAVTEELYVRSNGAVYAVAARTAGAIPSEPAKLISHRMFAPADIIIAVELPDFLLHHDGTRWQLQPPDTDLSQDDLVSWIERWRDASSITTEPGAAAAATDATVTLRDGRRIEISIKSRSPDLVLHRRDEGLDYHLDAHLATLLLASPSLAARPAR